MHLLAAKPGIVADEPVDLGQTRGDIAVLSAADTELAALAAAQACRGADAPSLRLANLLQLRHPMSVDLYVDAVVQHARLVAVRLLGGVAYWPYGIERVATACRDRGIPFAALPGDDQPDPELARHSTVGADRAHRLWQYLVHGGPANADNFLAYAAYLLGGEADWAEPVPLLTAGLYWPGVGTSDLPGVQASWTMGAPVAAFV